MGFGFRDLGLGFRDLGLFYNIRDILDICDV